MKKIFALLFPFLMYCLLTQSCGESDCSLSTISQARFDFLDSKTNKNVALTNGVMISGIATINNSAIVDTLFNQAESYMTLPLSYTNQTTYVMHYSETLRDTIWLTHKNIPFVGDIECGSMMYYKIEDLNYTTHVLDSVTLVNPEINNEEKKNFNIYFHATDSE
jgi:hypothetical protein